MTTDFAFNQAEILLPEEFKFTEAEQEQIRRARGRKPRREIITEGFYPMRSQVGVQIPVQDFQYNRNAIQFVNERLEATLPDLAKTTRDRVNRDLRRSFNEATKLGLRGEDLNDYITSQISDSLGKKRLGRASTIARTEGLALSQWAQDEVAEQIGIPLEKEWLARRDGVTRDTHLIADGQRVNKVANFKVGGYNMRYPADSSQGAPAGEIVNCRCTVIYHEKRRI